MSEELFYLHVSQVLDLRRKGSSLDARLMGWSKLESLLSIEVVAERSFGEWN
jgi:hypothetical protein